MFGKSKPNLNTCAACPYKHAENGCPAWIGSEAGFMETNPTTQEVRSVTGCFYQVIPRLMAHVVQAANRPAAVLQEWRNDVAKALGKGTNPQLLIGGKGGKQNGGSGT